MNVAFRFLNILTQSPNGFLHDGEPDGGAPSPSGPAAPTPSAAASPAIPASSASAPIAQATPAPATGGATPPEGWVPSYRIREAREAASREAGNRFAQEMAEVRAEADRMRSQLSALVGVTPPGDPEVEKVRGQFAKLFPGLAKMEERAADLEKVLERAGDFESQSTHYWQQYGQQAMSRLFTHAAESLGSPLTDEGKRALHSAFTGFVSSSPELTDRYANDPSLVEDFWRMFSSSFVDPVRRTATAGIVGRAGAVPNLPQDAPGGAPRATPAPHPANLDERVNSAWTAYQASKKG